MTLACSKGTCTHACWWRRRLRVAGRDGRRQAAPPARGGVFVSLQQQLPLPAEPIDRSSANYRWDAVFQTRPTQLALLLFFGPKQLSIVGSERKTVRNETRIGFCCVEKSLVFVEDVLNFQENHFLFFSFWIWCDAINFVLSVRKKSKCSVLFGKFV